MTELEGRAAMVRVALTWERTPFMWEACKKGVGVDCGRFPAAVLNEAGIRAIDVRKLPRLPVNWFMHRSDGLLVQEISKYAAEYEPQPGEKPQPGDIICARYGRDWAHCAIVIAWPKVIGAAFCHCVTIWNNVFDSPQYGHKKLKYFDPWRLNA